MSDASSLDEALKSLERDLTGDCGSIAAQSGIPFAILRYSPAEEFRARRLLRLFAHSLEQQHQLRAVFISLSALVWHAVRMDAGVSSLFQVEKERGFKTAEIKEVTPLIDDTERKNRPRAKYSLAKQIIERIDGLGFIPDLVFLVRSGGLAPSIYSNSALLNDLHLRGYATPTVLCFPGSSVIGSDLRYYDIPETSGLAYNYRVKIYGTL